jgi:ribosomal protein L11 methyltransferase
MPFQSLNVTLSQHDADAFGDALMALGAISVNVEDADEGTAAEKPIFGEPGAATGMWESCKLVALFLDEADVDAMARNAASMAEFQLPPYEIFTVEDVDWVQQNRDQFQPIQISPRIWIVPTWHTAPVADAINIGLDPGAAFGTGSHPTTRLCLQWLEANVSASVGAKDNQNLPCEKMLDYGTGSGILAIAAMKLGARHAMGVDIDAQAVETARYNATQNHVSIEFATTDRKLDYVADVTVANILANPLKVLAPLLASHTQAGGRLGSSS